MGAAAPLATIPSGFPSGQISGIMALRKFRADGSYTESRRPPS
jgi:hypothetical protein